MRFSAAARIVLVLPLTLVAACGEDPVAPGNDDPCLETSASGCWRALAPAPTRRQELQPAALDGKIFLVGGLTGTSFESAEVLSSVDAYDPSTDSWTAAAPFPEARHHVAVSAAGGKLFGFGGMVNPRPAQWTEQASAYAYDPTADSWSPIAPMPTARGEHLALTFEGKIYVIGGRESGRDSDANEAYDPLTDTWSTRAPMPTPRRSFAAAILDSLVYFVGGRVISPTTGGLENTDVVEAYSPRTDRWYARHDLTTGRGGLALGALNGRLYSMGGENLAGGGSVYTVNREYDPSLDAWRLVKSLPIGVHGTGAVTIGDTIYVLVGATRAGVYSSDVAQAFTVNTG